MKKVFLSLILVAFLITVIGVGSLETVEYEQAPEVNFAGTVLESWRAESFFQNFAEGYYIMQVTGPTTEELWERLNQEVTVHGYIPEQAYLVRANDIGLQRLREEGLIRNVWKFELPTIPEVENNEYAIIVFDDADVTKVHDALIQEEGDVRAVEEHSVHVIIDRERLENVVQTTEGILWIGPIEKYEITNDIVNDISNTPEIRTEYGLYGEGQIIGVIDTGLDTGVNDASMHDDIEGNILNLTDFVPPPQSTSPDDDQGHGTHVTGTIVGKGVKSGSNPGSKSYGGSYAGIAPEAKVIFQAYGVDTPSSLSILISATGAMDKLFEQSQLQGSRVHSNSWGCIPTSCPQANYTNSARTLDSFILLYKNPVVVFSAGNAGTQGAGSVKPPATAKNIISVGAVTNTNPDVLGGFSSIGPTMDGRIKPDILAPGVNTVSTRTSVGSGACSNIYNGNSDYASCSGTSMAAPAIAGMTALIREYYIKERNLPDPTAALIKATLINGAQDIGYGIPSNLSGWGRADLSESLPIDGRTLFFDDHPVLNMSMGKNVTHTIFVGSPQEALRVTLVWSDKPPVPGLPQSTKQLVSDLDLIVTDPKGKVYNGNDVLAPFNNTKDNTNNVERVEILTPKQGTYKIMVYTALAPSGGQSYALVATYKKASKTPSPPANPISGYGNSTLRSMNVSNSTYGP